MISRRAILQYSALIGAKVAAKSLALLPGAASNLDTSVHLKGRADPCDMRSGTEDPLDLPLYDTSKISYKGYFFVPTNTGMINGVNHQGFAYNNFGSSGLAFNPDGNDGSGSLFLTGSSLGNNNSDTIIGEIDIPEPQSDRPSRANLLQDFSLACGAPGVQQTAVTSGGPKAMGYPLTGLLVHSGKLYMTVSSWYYSEFQEYTLFVRDSLDLSSGTVRGPFKVNRKLNNRSTGAGLGETIPRNFWPVFNGKKAFIGGAGKLSVLSNTSMGPTILAFDPEDTDDLESYDSVEAPAAAWWDGPSKRHKFPFTTREQFEVQSEPFAGYNGMSTHRCTFMVPESRTVFAFGFHANSFYDTKGAEAGWNQGTRADGRFMRERFWLFDARDLKANLDSRRVRRNSPMWYGVHDMNFDLQAATKPDYCKEKLHFATFDQAGRNLYVLEERGEDWTSSARSGRPAIHVLSIPV